MFENGMLVLLPGRLVLYSADEQDEIVRIPVDGIESCRYSIVRRGLEVKYRINGTENLAESLAKKRARLADLKAQNLESHDTLKSTTSRDQQRTQQDHISEIDSETESLSREIDRLESDPTLQRMLRRDLADAKKEVFKLPKGFKSGISPRDEYRIWEYAINRRIRGPARLKIDTVPHGAVISVNGTAVGATPMLIDKPLVDEAVLEGKYLVDVCMEGYEPEKFEVSSGLDSNNTYKQFKLSARSDPDYTADKLVEQMRSGLADRRVDLAAYGTMQHVQGTDTTLYLGREQLVITAKTGELLAEIPYGAINDVAYDKGLFGGSKAVRIRYAQQGFSDSVFDFWIEGGSDSTAERSEMLADIIMDKNRYSHVRHAMPHMRHASHYNIGLQDVEDNFFRFTPYEFVILVARLFEKRGCKVSVMPQHVDSGMDVMAVSAERTTAIQARHGQARVGASDIGKILELNRALGADAVVAITTSDFTRQAYQMHGDAAELWNGQRVRDEFASMIHDVPRGQ